MSFDWEATITSSPGCRGFGVLQNVAIAPSIHSDDIVTQSPKRLMDAGNVSNLLTTNTFNRTSSGQNYGEPTGISPESSTSYYARQNNQHPKPLTLNSQSSSFNGLARLPETASFPPPLTQLLPFLYLGTLADAQTPELLEACGIRTLLNISEERYWTEPHLRVHRLAIPDSDCADISSLFDTSYRIIKRAQKRYARHLKQQCMWKYLEYVRDDPHGQLTPFLLQDIVESDEASRPPTLLLHCRMGVSRSPTIAAAFLMRRNGWSVDTALQLLYERRPCIMPNVGFLRALYRFDHILNPRQRLQRALELTLCFYTSEPLQVSLDNLQKLLECSNDQCLWRVSSPQTPRHGQLYLLIFTSHDAAEQAREAMVESSELREALTTGTQASITFLCPVLY